MRTVIYIQCAEDEAAERAHAVLSALDFEVREAEDLGLLHRRSVARIKARLARYLHLFVDAMLVTDDEAELARLAGVSFATARYWRVVVLSALGVEDRAGLVSLAAGEARRE